jgi:hypothetical protein
MMRQDGHAIFYVVQHYGHPGGGTRQDWVDTALGYMLFDGLSFSERRSARTIRWRKLIERQGASTDLWQRYGVDGYVEPSDATAMMVELQERRPDEKFRVVKRQIVQMTQVLAVGA